MWSQKVYQEAKGWGRNEGRFKWISHSYLQHGFSTIKNLVLLQDTIGIYNYQNTQYADKTESVKQGLLCMRITQAIKKYASAITSDKLRRLTSAKMHIELSIKNRQDHP